MFENAQESVATDVQTLIVSKKWMENLETFACVLNPPNTTWTWMFGKMVVSFFSPYILIQKIKLENHTPFLTTLHPNKNSPIETSKSQFSSASSHLAFRVWCLWQGAVSKFSPTIALKNNKDKNSFLSFQSESYSNYIEQVVNTQMGAVMGHALTLSWRMCTIASHQQHKFVWDLLLKYRTLFPKVWMLGAREDWISWPAHLWFASWLHKPLSLSMANSVQSRPTDLIVNPQWWQEVALVPLLVICNTPWHGKPQFFELYWQEEEEVVS